MAGPFSFCCRSPPQRSLLWQVLHPHLARPHPVGAHRSVLTDGFLQQASGTPAQGHSVTQKMVSLVSVKWTRCAKELPPREAALNQ